MAVGEYLGNGNPDGTSLGQTTSELISFYGVTPVAQPSGAGQAALTTTCLTAVATTATVTTTPHGFTTGTQGDAIIARVNQAVVDIAAIKTMINKMRTDLVALGLQKGSA